MSGLNFAFSVKAEKAVSKYAGKTGILVQKAPEEAGVSSKMELTAGLIERASISLSGSEYLTYGYDSENNPIIAFNAPKSSTSVRLAKNATISSKRLHKTLALIFELDTKKENFLNVSELKSTEGINYVNILGSDNEADVMTELKAEISLGSDELVGEVVIPEVDA